MMRKEHFEKLCFANNLDYIGSDQFGIIRYLEGFETFQHKLGTIEHLCSKKSNDLSFEIHMFDYAYMVMVGKIPVRKYHTVFFVNAKSLDLPIFILKPEHFGHSIAKYFGVDDIDFIEYPAFSDSYQLTGEHEEFIRYTFDDQVLRYFSKSLGWTIEATNYYLSITQTKEKVPNENLQDFYHLGMEVYQLFEKA